MRWVREGSKRRGRTDDMEYRGDRNWLGDDE